jgi:uncharacterized membrane protein YeaQ/YmgE (transglycosylase-associated protein family)
MAILDAVNGTITPEMISRIALELGDAEDAVSHGLTAAVTETLLSLAERTADPAFITLVPSLASIAASAASQPDRWGRACSSTFVLSLFGGNEDVSKAVEALSRRAGVSPATARTLLATGAVVMLAYLGHLIRQQHVDGAALAVRLRRERASLPNITVPEPVAERPPSGGSAVRRVAPVLIAAALLWQVLAIVRPDPSGTSTPFGAVQAAIGSVTAERSNDMAGILGWILFGLVIGIIAKLLMPGRDPGGIIVTILLGIAGALVGGFLGRLVGWYEAGEPAGFIMATLGAVLLLFLYRKTVRAA